MFGTPAVAAKAQLLIIMSGDYRSKKEVAYLLVPAVGRKVVDLGGNLEKGTPLLYDSFDTERSISLAPTFKLIGNSMILGTLEILSEAYTVAEKSGISADNIHSLVQGNLSYHSAKFKSLLFICASEIVPAPGYNLP